MILGFGKGKNLGDRDEGVNDGLLFNDVVGSLVIVGMLQLVRFFAKVAFTLLSLVSKEKEKVELVRLKLKSLPWLVSVWQKTML